MSVIIYAWPPFPRSPHGPRWLLQLQPSHLHLSQQEEKKVGKTYTFLLKLLPGVEVVCDATTHHHCRQPLARICPDCHVPSSKHQRIHYQGKKHIFDGGPDRHRISFVTLLLPVWRRESYGRGSLCICWTLSFIIALALNLLPRPEHKVLPEVGSE